jgi:hypothetical protein
MREIVNYCIKCKEVNKHNEMILIEWSPFDLGITKCEECGYTINYNEERKNEELAIRNTNIRND